MTERTRAAMLKQLFDSGVVTADLIRVPNVAFTTPASGGFLEVAFLPVVSAPSTVGGTGFEDEVDIMQITIAEPAHTGEVFSSKCINLLRSVFVPSVSLQYEEESAMIEKVVKAPAFSSDTWWKTPVSVYFRSRVPRQ